MEMKAVCVDMCTLAYLVILFIWYRIDIWGLNQKCSDGLLTKKTKEWHSKCSGSQPFIPCATGTKDQQTNLHFYSNAWLWTTTHLKITNSFHFWFKRKCCVCIKWTQTDDASSFVMQVLLIISGGIHCVTLCGVELFNLWPSFFLFS